MACLWAFELLAIVLRLMTVKVASCLHLCRGAVSRGMKGCGVRVNLHFASVLRAPINKSQFIYRKITY